MKKPDLNPKTMDLSLDYVNSLLGVSLSGKEVQTLLERMRYKADPQKDKLKVHIPAYRCDILHPIDLVEDAAIAYGYMDFKPENPSIYCLGKHDPQEIFHEQARDMMIGLGFREAITLMLTSPKNNFQMMNLEVGEAVTAIKPVSADQGIIRTWLLPSLMGFLEQNRNREYPQMIFEVGDTLNPDGEKKTKAAAVIASGKTNYSQIKSIINGLLHELKMEAEDEPTEHPSFIPGRASKNKHGFYGEIHPQVLGNYGIEVPVTAFEINLN
jgi:phenylalanyl-tRNA synthetase beta chain